MYSSGYACGSPGYCNYQWPVFFTSPSWGHHSFLHDVLFMLSFVLSAAPEFWRSRSSKVLLELAHCKCPLFTKLGAS